MEKERKIEAPDGCEIEKVELVNGAAVVTFREKKRKLPKSWEGFCGLFPMKLPYNFAIKKQELYSCDVVFLQSYYNRLIEEMEKFTGDRATAEAILALCQLIQLRDCYNGDWVPDWKDKDEIKYIIQFDEEEIHCDTWLRYSVSPLYFKTEDLRDEFLRNFRDQIEKLKPLYGIKEGGEE
jgi:hypothetical protein